ncbi:thiol:disulfide interchange protein dsbD, putative [unidentified eubacterium SCB49]|nr:thiol:disulfide interchange protein dsbD, putative [unidentified eubacterium SCB49]
MRKFAFLVLAMFAFISTSTSQILEPVKWTSEVKKTGEDTYDLIFNAEIEDKWHLYTQNIPENGPIPTTFNFENEEGKYELVGDVSESKSHSSFDKIFEMELSYFDHSAQFIQKIKVLDPSLSTIVTSVDFQSCDDEKCIFEMAELEFALPAVSSDAIASLSSDLEQESQILEPVKWASDVKKIGDDTYELIFNAAIEDKWHLYTQNIPENGPIPTTFNFENEEGKYELVGGVSESESHSSFDKIFEMELSYFDHSAQFIQKIKVLDPSLTKIVTSVDFQSCDDEKCIFEMAELEFTLPGADVKIEEATAGVSSVDTIDSEDEEESRGMLTIFILSFLSGFAALLTPCVFPMIPMTVSFFTKQSKNKAAGIKNAIMYGIFIIVIYVLLGSLVTGIFGADALNALSTNVWFNVIFFFLLVIFAMSFLGAFEIMLPNSWANKIDSKADKGGMIGIFFMALALAIVSFSCTGPIVGTLLVEAASKGGLAPIIGMLGFSLAIALPFALFAMFPGWLNSLPKSGGWLNTVKVVLGFLELALAFKFLSQADLVLQLHWLEREVFIAIWIAVFGTLGLYLLGKITLPHDSPLTHISVGRLMLALLTLSFTVYMIPGLWGAPLNLISAFPPPQEYSESPYGVGFSKLGGGSASADHSTLPDGGHLMAPHDILHFYDYEKGLAYAKEVGKPVMVDFTGYACVNCRKMEQNVWTKGDILSILKNEVVLISLYVDDKKELPEAEKYVSPTTGKKIKTIGNKWSDLQITRYKANAQPYYILMDHSEENLIKPVGYTPDVEDYEAWLRGGISKFN